MRAIHKICIYHHECRTNRRYVRIIVRKMYTNNTYYSG